MHPSAGTLTSCSSYWNTRRTQTHKTDDHATRLHLAVANGKPEAARLLLEHGASIHARNKDRQTPFQIASETGNQEVMQLLREHMLRQRMTWNVSSRGHNVCNLPMPAYVVNYIAASRFNSQGALRYVLWMWPADLRSYDTLPNLGIRRHAEHNRRIKEAQMTVLLSRLDVYLNQLFDFGYERIRWPGCRPRDLSHGPASPQKVFTAYPAAIAIVENRIHSSKLDHVRSAM